MSRILQEIEKAQAEARQAECNVQRRLNFPLIREAREHENVEEEMAVPPPLDFSKQEEITTEDVRQDSAEGFSVASPPPLSKVDNGNEVFTGPQQDAVPEVTKVEEPEGNSVKAPPEQSVEDSPQVELKKKGFGALARDSLNKLRNKEWPILDFLRDHHLLSQWAGVAFFVGGIALGGVIAWQAVEPQKVTEDRVTKPAPPAVPPKIRPTATQQQPPVPAQQKNVPTVVNQSTATQTQIPAQIQPPSEAAPKPAATTPSPVTPAAPVSAQSPRPPAPTPVPVFIPASAPPTESPQPQPVSTPPQPATGQPGDAKDLIAPKPVSTPPQPATPPAAPASIEKAPPPPTAVSIEKNTSKTVSAVGGLENEVKDFLKSWSEAWGKAAGPSGNIDEYMNHYSELFSASKMSKTGWRKDKQSKLKNKQWLKIDISNLVITELTPGKIAKARFVQAYNSPELQVTSRKTMILGKEPEGWRIVNEKSE